MDDNNVKKVEEPKQTVDDLSTDEKEEVSSSSVQPQATGLTSTSAGSLLNNLKKLKLTPLNIVGIVLLVIFVPLIIINVTLAIKGAVNKDEVPTFFNRAPLIIASDSMAIGYYTTDENYNGAFNKNDLIVIKRTDTSKLEIGEIATYIAKDGSVITHRVVGKTTDEEGNILYTMKGDNSPSSDFDPVSPEQIQGVYVSRFPKLGGLAMKLSEPMGIFVVMLIPLATLGVVYFIQNRKKEEK